MIPIFGLFLAHFSLNVFANICFKKSAASQGMKRFSAWQIAGNLSGFGGVLAFTALLRFLPMSVAFPITQGLAVIGVQLIAAWLLFKEKITWTQWLGTVLVVIGIILISSPGF